MGNPRIPWILGMCLALGASPAHAGGGGVMQTDQCVVELGFMQAHLTIYQPETRGSQQFCDAAPDLTGTVFVLDYLHDSLNQAPIEFRIIRNETGLGRFAKWRDVAALDDLEPLTVYHREPVTSPGGNFEAEYRFELEGEYLVLVTAEHPTGDEVYRAVMPLQVGGANWLLWGGIALGIIVLAGALVIYLRRKRVRTP